MIANTFIHWLSASITFLYLTCNMTIVAHLQSPRHKTSPPFVSVQLRNAGFQRNTTQFSTWWCAYTNHSIHTLSLYYFLFPSVTPAYYNPNSSKRRFNISTTSMLDIVIMHIHSVITHFALVLSSIYLFSFLFFSFLPHARSITIIF